MTPADLAALRQQLIRHEGLKLKPYLCPSGKLTIGVGRNLEARGISPDEAAILLDNDITDTIRQLSRALPGFMDLDAWRKRGLADIAFTVGVAGLLKFKKMLAFLWKGDYASAAREATDSRWAAQVGPDRTGYVAYLLEHGAEPPTRDAA